MRQAGNEDLLHAAARLFRAKGFAASTVREIATEAGMLPGSVHYRFSTKEELIVALMEKGMRRAMEAVKAAVESTDHPLEKIRLAMRVHCALLVSGDGDVHALLYELRSLAEADRVRIIALRDAYESFWDGLLYGAHAAGLLKKGLDLRMVRLSILGSLNWTAQWYQPDGGLTPEGIADRFFDTAVSGLVPETVRPDQRHVERVLDETPASKGDPE